MSLKFIHHVLCTCDGVCPVSPVCVSMHAHLCTCMQKQEDNHSHCSSGAVHLILLFVVLELTSKRLTLGILNLRKLLLGLWSSRVINTHHSTLHSKIGPGAETQALLFSRQAFDQLSYHTSPTSFILLMRVLLWRLKESAHCNFIQLENNAW